MKSGSLLTEMDSLQRCSLGPWPPVSQDPLHLPAEMKFQSTGTPPPCAWLEEIPEPRVVASGEAGVLQQQLMRANGLAEVLHAPLTLPVGGGERGEGGQRLYQHTHS